MADPTLFLVDDDPDTLTALAATLRRRFGADYQTTARCHELRGLLERNAIPS